MKSPAQASPEPFWNRLRAISLYPLRDTALIVVAALTLASFLGYLPGTGWIFLLLVHAGAYRYAFAILRASADGELDPPETTIAIADHAVWKLFGLQVAFGCVIFIAFGGGGEAVGLVTLAVFAFLQPGCMISLAIDGRFGRAVDPTTPLTIAGRIGWPYCAVFGLLFVIQASAITGGQWLMSFMPRVLGDFAAMAFFLWGLFAAFHLMGYLVYQYHEALGHVPETHRRVPVTLEDKDAVLLGTAEAHLRDGHPQAALALLREEIRMRPVTLAVHELFRRLLRQAGDPAAVQEHARALLNLLMLRKQERQALALLREALADDPGFVPLRIEHGEQLASRAMLGGQAQLALDVWQAMSRHDPQHPNAPRWALGTATVLVERFGRDAEARVLLERARDQSRETQLTDQIDAALKALTPA
jgi:tetratricopeptide (TPR) repeat protein